MDHERRPEIFELDIQTQNTIAYIGDVLFEQWDELIRLQPDYSFNSLTAKKSLKDILPGKFI